MSKTYNNGIITTAGFQFNANLPLDDRLVVKEFKDLSTLNSYDGMIVYVQSDKRHYKFVDNIWSSFTTGESDNPENKIDNITVNESSFIFGDAEKDNLESTSEHSVVAGKDIKAGVRGLKIISTTVNSDNTVTIVVSDNLPAEESKTAEQYYGDFDLTDARATLILSHQLFETYKVDAIANNVISLSLINENNKIPASYLELSYADDEKTELYEHGNYMWLYKRIDEDRYTTFDITFNDNCPIRPEADFTYALGDNIQVVGRSSFSSGQGNQNMGWYSATMGRFNTAYYSAFALGAFNNATGTYAVALNQNTEASAVAATSKGYGTKATANYSEAGGQQTEANHKASFVHGFHTKSGRQHQAVFGEHNEINKTALFVVGNGVGEIKQTISKTLPADWNDPASSVYPQPLEFIPSEWTATYTAYKVSDDTEISGTCGDGIVDLDIREGELYIYGCSYDITQVKDVVIELTYSIIEQAEVKSNAFTVEPDGSARVQTQGVTEDSIVINKTLDTIKEEVNESITESAKIALLQAENTARDLDATGLKYIDSLGNFLLVEQETLHSGATKLNSTDYDIDNIEAGNTVMINTATRCADSYKNYEYSFDVTVTEINTATSIAQAPRFSVAKIDGTEVYLQIRNGAAFLWGCELLPETKFTTTNIGDYLNPQNLATFHKAKLAGFKPTLNTKYSVCFRVTNRELLLTINGQEFKVTSNADMTIEPIFDVNAQYAKAEIRNRQLYAVDGKLRSFVNKEYVDTKIKDIKAEIPIEVSEQGSHLFGDDLQSSAEHGILSGSNITAGVRGLKVLATSINEDNKGISLTVEGYNGQTAEQLYTEEAGYIYAKTRAALILAHHSFESFRVMSFIGNVITLAPINPDMPFVSEYYELHKDNTTRNYVWLYNVDNSDEDNPVYDISINDNCPIRPEVDYTYALGNNINVVGRGSFSSGAYNQNMGWYAATLGVDNLAYYAGFALGGGNKALGTYSVAMNQNTTATATGSTAKGHKTKATANYSEAGGLATEANHTASSAFGYYTKTGRQHQTVVGELNAENNTALFVVGNGSGRAKEHSGSIEVKSSSFPIALDGPIVKGSLSFVQTITLPSMHGTTESMTYTWSDNADGTQKCTPTEANIKLDIDYNKGIINSLSYTSLTSSYSNTFDLFSYDTTPITLNYTTALTVYSNALEVEKDGSAAIGKTGDKDNSVTTKEYVDTQDSRAVLVANNSYFVERFTQFEKCESNQPHNNIVIDGNTVTCTSNAVDIRNRYRAQVTNNYADKYKNLNYELKFKINEFKDDVTHDGLWFKFVDYVSDNRPVEGAEGWGIILREKRYVLGYITTDNFSYITSEVNYPEGITLNTTDSFKLDVKLNGSVINMTLTNSTKNISGNFTYDLGNDYQYTPSLAMGFRLAKAAVTYEIFSDEYVALDNKKITVDLTYNPQSINAQSGQAVAEAIAASCAPHVKYLVGDGTQYFYNFDEGNYILKGTFLLKKNDGATTVKCVIDSETMATVGRDSNNKVYLTLFNSIQSDVHCYVIEENDYTRTQVQLAKTESTLNKVTTLQRNLSDDNYPTAKAVKTYVDDTASKYDNFLMNNNNYVYLETLTSDGRTGLMLNDTGFTDYISTSNETGRTIEYSNKYRKSYDDFLIKVDMQISSYTPEKDTNGNLIGVKNAVGPFVFLFDGELAQKSIQFRCGNNDFVTWIEENGALSQVTNIGIANNLNADGTPKTFTFYFKFIRSAGLLNIYQDNLDNLKVSIALNKGQLANSTPKLAFGGRFCNYSVTCELYKADYRVRPTTNDELNNITIRDPYTYYMIEE